MIMGGTVLPVAMAVVNCIAMCWCRRGKDRRWVAVVVGIRRETKSTTTFKSGCFSLKRAR